MSGGFGEARDAQEQHGDSCANRPSRQSRFPRMRGEQFRESHSQGILRGTDGDALQTAGTFDAADLEKFIDWQR